MLAPFCGEPIEAAPRARILHTHAHPQQQLARPQRNGVTLRLQELRLQPVTLAGDLRGGGGLGSGGLLGGL
jgi:hypothetical protein